MSKRRFTIDEQETLRQNQHVRRCSQKSITFDPTFKLRAVRQYLDEGCSAKEIFSQAGFDLLVIGKDTPKHCLKSWRRVYMAKGTCGLKKEMRGRHGGRTKPKDKNDTDTIKRLTAEVAYLKAENDFLAKLRAKRTE